MDIAVGEMEVFFSVTLETANACFLKNEDTVFLHFLIVLHVTIPFERVYWKILKLEFTFTLMYDFWKLWDCRDKDTYLIITQPDTIVSLYHSS